MDSCREAASFSQKLSPARSDLTVGAKDKIPWPLALLPLTSHQGSPQAWGPVHAAQTASWDPEMGDSEGEMEIAGTEDFMKEVAWGLRFKNE